MPHSRYIVNGGSHSFTFDASAKDGSPISPSAGGSVIDDDNVGNVRHVSGEDYCLDVAEGGNLEVWTAPLSGGRHAVGLLNRSPSSAKISASWDVLGLSTGSKYDAMDAWSGDAVGTALDGTVEAQTASRALSLLILSPAKEEGKATSAKSDDEGRPSLSILDFGGKPNDSSFNNQQAIAKAMKQCDSTNGCTLTFPRLPGPAPNCPTPDCHGATTYLTSAINLTSHLKLVLPDGVQLRGTEDFKFNCGGSNASTCDDLDSPSWPVIPWYSYPAPDNLGGSATPAKQSFIRGYNLSDVEITGGGSVHAGGGWWWCVRMNAFVDPRTGRSGAAGAHSPQWCPQMVNSGAIPGLTLQAPHFLHLISSTNIVLDNITISSMPWLSPLPSFASRLTLRLLQHRPCGHCTSSTATELSSATPTSSTPTTAPSRHPTATALTSIPAGTSTSTTPSSTLAMTRCAARVELTIWAARSASPPATWSSSESRSGMATD